MIAVERIAGAGWLALLGGGEFSFGETEEADRAWLAKVPDGPIGFIPAASGSQDYGRHFTTYLDALFGRAVEIVPVYRRRDALRGKNAERIAALPAIYLGGGVTDHLLDTLAGTPVLDALGAKLRDGGLVAAIAASAQACGCALRSLLSRDLMAGLGWLPHSVIEPNFDPGHDRRLRQLIAAPGARQGLGLPAGAALLLGPEGRAEVSGTVFEIGDAEDDLHLWQG